MACCHNNNNQDEDGQLWVQGPIIVGAGPAGLAAAACLSRTVVAAPVILEQSDCIASLWQRKTYDRLKLHLPKQFCELPLLGFPKDFPKYPTKHQFISYMNAYAAHFNLQPNFGEAVESAEFDLACGLWRVRTRRRVYFSRWLVVATGENAVPNVPEFAGMERFGGRKLHTSEYKSGTEFRNQKVLVVGCGNSGMEVSLDLCRNNATPYMIVRSTVHVLPREMFGFSTFGIAMALLKWLPLRVVDKFLLMVTNFTLGKTDPLGLRRPKTGPIELKNATGKTPVLDVGALSQLKAGKIKLMNGLKEITRNGAKFNDGQEKEFDAIVFATGYKSNVPAWLKGTDFFTEEEGMPKNPYPGNWKGENGLYTVGFSRRGLLGAGFDAINIARDISEQWRTLNDPKNCCESHRRTP